MRRLYYGLYMSSRYDKVEVLDYTKSTVLYSAQIQKSKPQISIFRPSDEMLCEELVALVTFHKLSSDIGIQMRDGRQLNMKRKHVLSKISRVENATFEWSWKGNDLISGNLRLIEDESNTVAKLIEASSWSRRGLGYIAISGHFSSSIIDEIVVTGLAKLGYRLLGDKMLIRGELQGL